MKLFTNIIRKTSDFCVLRFRKLALLLLNDPAISRRLWDIVHRNNSILLFRNNIHKYMFESATQKSAEYIVGLNHNTRPFSDNYELLKHSLDIALKNNIPDGLFLEFGVFSGTSVNFIASFIGDKKVVHGFDSFEGLPEDWNATAFKGQYDAKGRMPDVEKNVILHKGLFESSIPVFLERPEIRSKQIAFLHVDCDLYSSTKTILGRLREMIVPGTVIQFDEFFNYPEFEYHEFKAFHEFIAETGLKYKLIGFANYHTAASVVIEDGSGRLNTGAACVQDDGDRTKS